MDEKIKEMKNDTRDKKTTEDLPFPIFPTHPGINLWVDEKDSTVKKDGIDSLSNPTNFSTFWLIDSILKWRKGR